MRATGPSVVIIHHLKSLGIKLRMPKKTVSPDVQRKSSSGGLFGVPLQSLPPSTEGEVPQLVVDICQFLSCHLSTEGLFRKSGSVNRIKALKAQLESGVTSLSSAHPSDVAALLKQFFRELPQPLLTPELQDPLCQIQQAVCEEERGSATTLVTCLLPPVHGETLRFFCTFLQSVASRCDENRMDSGNLAVVLAPSLFSSSNLGEKLTLATEKQLQLQASAIQSLIERAQDIGQVPSFILEKISLPCDVGEEDAVSQNLEGLRRRRRRSMSGLVNDALNKLKSSRGPSSLLTDRVLDEMELPRRNKTKRKASEDSVCSELCTPKKRKSLREIAHDNVDNEDMKVPSACQSPLSDDVGGGDVFSDFSTSPGDFLDLNSESPAVPPTPDSSSSHGQKGRNKRRNSKRVKSRQSGQVSISPAQMDRKEKVRNSLRIFYRARTAKPPQPTPECKSLEQTGWHLMKKMVAEALEGPFFNGRDFRMALKTSHSVDTPGNKPPTSSPSLMSSPSLKSLALGSEEVESVCSGKKRRTLRRSLSMPEKMGECVQAEGDPEAFLETSLTINKESRNQEDRLNFSTDNAYMQVFDGDPLKHGLGTDHPQDVSDQVSMGDQSSPQPVPTLRRPNGHTSQYRSVRKLVLSFPWTPSISDLDTQQKDWEKLATHTIRRKGARRFGRSLSQECGLRAGGGQIGFQSLEDNSVGGNPKLCSARNRQVFVSRKNITLSNWGQRSLEVECQASLEDSLMDTGRQLLDTPLSLDKYPLNCSRLEPISDTVDL